MAFCTVCGSEVSGGAFCGSCGAETGEAAATAMPVPQTMQPQQTFGLAEPVGKVGSWLQGLLITAGILALLAVPSQLGALGTAQDFENGTISELDALIRITDQQSGGLQILLGLIPLPIFVLFIIWTHRSYKNLYVFGVRDLPKSTGWAIGGWFIPVDNAFGPKGIIDNVWRATAPEPIDAGWTRRPREQWFTVGWVAFWSGSAISLFVGVAVARSVFAGLNDSGGQFTVVPPVWALQLGILATFLSLGGQFLTAYGLRIISTRYETKRRHISRDSRDPRM